MKNFKLSNTTIYNRAEHTKENPFTTITQQLINDERLNIIELGLMVKILSNNDNYILYSHHLQEVSKLKDITFQKSFKHLQELNYIKKVHQKTGGIKWIVNEQPETPNIKKTISTTTKKQSSQLVDNHHNPENKDMGNNIQYPNNHHNPENKDMGNIDMYLTPEKTGSQLVDNHHNPVSQLLENKDVIINNIHDLFQKSGRPEFLEKNKPQNQNPEPDSGTRVLGKKNSEIEVKDLFFVSPPSFDYGVNKVGENISSINEEQNNILPTKEPKTEEQNNSPINEEQKEEPSINDLIKNIINGNKKIGLPTENKTEEQKNSISNLGTTREEQKTEQPVKEQENSISNIEQPTEQKNMTTNGEPKTEQPVKEQEKEINFGTARTKPKTEQPVKGQEKELPTEGITEQDIKEIKEVCSLTFGDKIPNWEKLVLNLGIEKFVSRNIEYFEQDEQLFNDVQTFVNYRTKK